MPNRIAHKIFLVLISFLPVYIVHSQEQFVSIKVYSENRQIYAFPWAGGMNSCQFGKVDINLDGLKDLVVFDRAGDRIMPFLAVKSGDNFDYDFAPEYAGNFPVISHWAIFADYDFDGKEDIFTYSPGYAGLKVYRNVSESVLEFELVVFPFLTSFQGGGYVNILVTYADYPAICDLDGDGDLDILTFYGLGSFVEKHRNMSMEKYGHADSLDFMQTEYCWGFFAESDESNDLTLDTCLRCSGMEAWRHGGMDVGSQELPTADRRPLTADRHTGSTFCILDLNGDALPDLLLGDVDYPNLVALYNGGTTDTARMASFDWNYPPGDRPVSLFSMPASFYDDFDFDGTRDMLVAPFDPNPFLPENFQSTWLYHNDGTDDQPQFSLETMSFLQDRMLDFGAGAYPGFFDIDKDGLTDLLVGNYGYYDTSYYDEFFILHTEQNGKLAYLKNTGTTTQPAFTFIERDFAGVSALDLKGIVPAFGDLDGDGDTDMLLGCETGQIILYFNTAGTGEPVNMEFSEINYQNLDVGAFSTPQLFDLDRDNLADLVIGEKGGNLNYYRNTGTLQKPAFMLVTDSLGKINVTDPAVSLDGYSVPFFYRDASDYTHLLVGSEQGVIYYFTAIDGNLTGKFTKSDTLAAMIGLQEFKTDRGYRSAPALSDLDLDGYPDLICGNFSGGLEYLGNGPVTPVSKIDDPFFFQNKKLKIFPVPARDHITISCDDCKDVQFADIHLYDSRGVLVFTYSGNYYDNVSIDTESFLRGIFFLQVILSEKKCKCTYTESSKIILF